MWAMEVQSRATGRLWRRFGSERPAPRVVRPYVVGDIHGRADLQDAATAGAALACRVGYLGDYVDRGFDSKEVINWCSTGRWPASRWCA
jgi:hypothetical protein